MTTPRLTQLYDRLTIKERIPLLLAAQARGDASEYQRLLRSSPQRTWCFAEHLWTEQALHVLALTYTSEQLDAAAGYFFARWRLEDAAEEWLPAADACAYFFAANAAAWRRFCTGLGIAPAALTAVNHRGRFLEYCEEHLPAHAPTADALQAQFPESDRGDESDRGELELVTADGLLARWRNLWQDMTRQAPRRSGEAER
jgi:hypothetical protein